MEGDARAVSDGASWPDDEEERVFGGEVAAAAEPERVAEQGLLPVGGEWPCEPLSAAVGA